MLGEALEDGERRDVKAYLRALETVTGLPAASLGFDAPVPHQSAPGEMPTKARRVYTTAERTVDGGPSDQKIGIAGLRPVG